jgi:hypothetical protein
MMDEQQLRAIVRDVIARRLGGATCAPAARPAHSDPSSHASHGLLRLVTAAQQDGPCVIEPHVACDHCGYCKSMGH